MTNTIVEQSALKCCGCGEAVSDRRRVSVGGEDEGVEWLMAAEL